MRFKTRARFAIDDPGLASGNLLGSDQPEIISVGNFANKLAAVLSFLEFLFFALPAIIVGFIFAFVDELLDLLFFLARFLGVERFVVLFDQSLHWRSVNFQNLVGLYFGGFDLPLAVQFVLYFPVSKGVIALPFLVFKVLV